MSHRNAVPGEQAGRDACSVADAGAGLGVGEYNAAHATAQVAAVNKILAFLKQPPLDACSGQKQDAVNRALASRSIEVRDVSLTGAWYRDAIGPYLGETADGNPVAILSKHGTTSSSTPRTTSACA